MMKKVTYLVTVLFALALINLGCEKENPNPDDENSDVVLRISKMTDNIENTMLFQYNSDGLIIKVDVVSHNYYHSIEYDEQNRPIKYSMIEYGYYDGVQTNNIEWTDAGFIISRDSHQSIYILDSEGRIIKRSTTKDGVLSDSYREYNYVGESKMIIERKSASGEINETFTIYFGDV